MINLRPYITEKTVNLAKEGHFTLKVDKSAKKTQIKSNVEEIFKVKVRAVKIICRKATEHKKIKGNIASERMIKKAIVFLDKNDVIPGFEIADDSKKGKKDKTKNQTRESKKS